MGFQQSSSACKHTGFPSSHHQEGSYSPLSSVAISEKGAMALALGTLAFLCWSPSLLIYEVGSSCSLGYGNDMGPCTQHTMGLCPFEGPCCPPRDTT